MQHRGQVPVALKAERERLDRVAGLLDEVSEVHLCGWSAAGHAHITHRASGISRTMSGVASHDRLVNARQAPQ
jgi:hypothetical protein